MRTHHNTEASTDDTPTVRDNGDIIIRLTDFLNRFIAFPEPEQATICALWILHTYAFDAAYATPYLYVNSAEPQCGKTRVVEILSLLARNSIKADSVTASTIFRYIEDNRPTILIDEADAIFTGSANEVLRGVLNSGYKHNGFVLRTLPGKGEDDVVKFPTFCPKLLAGIDNGQMPATIADRCITITLKRKRKDQEVERYLPRRVEPQAEALKAEVLAWVLDNMDGIISWEPPIVDEISDRAFEISEPLLQIAMQAGPAYASAARDAIVKIMTTKTTPLTPSQKVLATARDILFAGDVPADKVQSAVLAEALGVNAKQIGAWLDRYDIKSNICTFGGTRARGYYRTQFEDAWERYL